jgi:hypothetical protein
MRSNTLALGSLPLAERQHVAFLLCKDFHLALAATFATFDMDMQNTISPSRDGAALEITQLLPT